MLLQQLGAEVVKVEPPGGDPIKQFMPGGYEYLNRGKAILTADLKSGAGIELVSQYLTYSDVVVEGFRPGTASRLHVGFEDASAVSPSVIYCSLSGYGQSGPLAKDGGHSINFEA